MPSGMTLSHMAHPCVMRIGCEHPAAALAAFLKGNQHNDIQSKRIGSPIALV